jgi:type II secretory pathway pseudopilin PulG
VRGISLIELLLVLALLATVSGIAIPSVTYAARHARLRGAAFHLASQVTQLRLQAIRRSVSVALRFSTGARGYGYQAFMDGDGDGVQTADILAGQDQGFGSSTEIQDDFPGVWFGFLPGCPLVDGGRVPAGADPVRIGTAHLLVMTPAGTATSGTLYLRSDVDMAYAVVVLGATGRTRLLACRARAGAWVIDGR